MNETSVCKYCDNISDTDVTSCKVDFGILGEAYVNTWISGYHICTGVVTHDEGVIDTIDSTVINFCPICGRQLVRNVRMPITDLVDKKIFDETPFDPELAKRVNNGR